MNPVIFREYDIRGIAGRDMDTDDAILIGKGIASYLRLRGRTKVVVGQDCRTTSQDYARHLVEGLRSAGCDVIDIGVCPSPVLYFAIQHLKQGGGVMVTASHNPAEYNGFKICIDSDSVHGDGLQEIRRLIENQQFQQGKGMLERANVIDAYHDLIKSQIHLQPGLKVAVDAGNGTAGVVAVPLLKALGCEVHDIYCDMDGSFPNHPADPTVAAHLVDLIKLVKTEGLDLGIGFDGDGDRIGVVDGDGNIIYGDKLMIIFSREILSRKPGATFISEVKCSQTLYDDIEKNGGRAIMWRTGHSLIKQKMKEVKAALAGEMSGHMFFADRYLGYDDATYAACRLLEILSHTQKTISALLSDVPQTFTTPEIRVDCPDAVKFDVVKKIMAIFKARYDVIDIDGVRVLFDDGWGLVRASNTQPALVLRFEALTEARLNEIRQFVETTLAKVQGS